ncbi:energy transducer TonB [Lacibacter sediminis]|uniref:Energy transducer TonB n=1 Tax=Lacibacter sediminis TaxID=2760713 RepID=A0A7G5XIF0_9BACT|nr:energy transducer TonB [Lacibacter sediminis]QNA45253.1 energy transducer TonB [Lacibacter sediminis]
MEVNKILSADFLDILFDQRNKEYGAYELRKNYQKRLTTALLMTAGAALLIFLMVIVGRSVSDSNKNKVKVQDVTLAEIKQEQPEKIEPPPPPPPKQEPPKIEITKFTPPKIVEDEKFDEKQEVKEVEEITNVGKIDQEGIKDPEIVNPPKVEEETKVVEAPKEDPNQVFTKVEVEAQFPGGEGKWNQYVQREVEKNIDDLVDDGQAGTCEVQFIVDKEGNVSNVEALSMKGSKLAEVAVNAIKRGPKWIPAIQNGRQVKAWRRQKITFRLPDEQP